MTNFDEVFQVGINPIVSITPFQLQGEILCKHFLSYDYYLFTKDSRLEERQKTS